MSMGPGDGQPTKAEMYNQMRKQQTQKMKEKQDAKLGIVPGGRNLTGQEQ
jgi:hypothetical protein